MSDHYDGVSEPMSRAEKEAMRRDEADYDALAARLAEKDETIDRMQGLLETCDASMETLRARLAEAERDAARYRYMRGVASFRDRNGPGLYWYLPRFLPGGSAEQLDASIDASITAVSADDVINAQHDETGRTWRGPRSQLPSRYFEVEAICCLDYPRCDCNSPPEPDNAPTLQPCGHPWKAQHDSKCILCSSPGDATSAQLAEAQRFSHSAPAGCNHFPGQVNCEWCTEPERATQPVEPKP